MGADDHGDGEENEEEVGDDVADGHGDELGVALAALTSRVRKDLPVHVEGPAFDEVGDDDGDEGGDEGDPNEDEGYFIRTLPADVEPFEEFQNGVFENP